MDIRKLQRAIVDGLLDVKGNDIVAFNTEHLTPLFERVIIASGTSNRQTKALASSVRETVKKRGLAVLRTEGEDNGEWIIVDCGAAVAHIMQPNIRDYYRLEEIWGGKPVKMRLGEGAEAGLPKAGTTTAGAGGKAPAPVPVKTAGQKAAKTRTKPSPKPPAKASARAAAKPTAKPTAKPAPKAAPKTARKTAPETAAAQVARRTTKPAPARKSASR